MRTSTNAAVNSGEGPFFAVLSGAAYLRFVNQWNAEVIAPVEALIDRWTRENKSVALGRLLPGWRSNDGLTDGWHWALHAVRSAADSEAVAADEQAILRQVADLNEHALTTGRCSS